MCLAGIFRRSCLVLHADLAEHEFLVFAKYSMPLPYQIFIRSGTDVFRIRIYMDIPYTYLILCLMSRICDKRISGDARAGIRSCNGKPVRQAPLLNGIMDIEQGCLPFVETSASGIRPVPVRLIARHEPFYAVMAPFIDKIVRVTDDSRRPQRIGNFRYRPRSPFSPQHVYVFLIAIVQPFIDHFHPVSIVDDRIACIILSSVTK